MINHIISLSGLVALIGTYLLILSYVRTHYFDKVRENGLLGEGTVVALNENPKAQEGGKSKGFAPVVEFIPAVGVSNFRYASTTYQNPTPYYVGQKVEVYYHGFTGVNYSRREVALIDDVPGDSPKKLLKWGIILCVISYPFVIYKLLQLF